MIALNFVIILLCVIVSILCIALKLLIADFREVRIKVLKLETFIEADDFADEFVNGLKDLHIDADRKTEPNLSEISTSKIIEAYAKGWTDGAEAVKAMPQTERPCDNCQEFDCYGCEHKRTEREGE